MLYVAIFAVSLLTASNAGCTNTAIACDSTLCQTGECIRDADIQSSTYGCEICQDYDPCSNYPDYCETAADCQSASGVTMECTEARWQNQAGSYTVCPYCIEKDLDTTNACTDDSDCGDRMYRCYRADPNSNLGECLNKCPDEDCVLGTTVGGIANVCYTSSTNVAGTCVADTSDYQCRKCEDSTTIDTTTTEIPATPAPTDQTCDVSWGVISISGVTGSYCGLTLDDCETIPEGEINDNYKAEMFRACPELVDCWVDRISLNSCQCPQCPDPTPAPTDKDTDPCDNVNGWPCDTIQDCIRDKGYGYECVATSSTGCSTCQYQCDDTNCDGDSDCTVTTTAGGVTTTKQGSCTDIAGNNYGCKECIYETDPDPTPAPTDKDECDDDMYCLYDSECVDRTVVGNTVTTKQGYCEDYVDAAGNDNGCKVCVYETDPDPTPEPTAKEECECIPGSLAILDGCESYEYCSGDSADCGECVKYCANGGCYDDNQCTMYNDDKVCERDTTTSPNDVCGVCVYDTDPTPEPTEKDTDECICEDECESYQYCGSSTTYTSSGLVETSCGCMNICDDSDANLQSCYNDEQCNQSPLDIIMYCVDNDATTLLNKCGYCSTEDDSETDTDGGECCTREDYEAAKAEAIGIPFGGYACCPDGTIGQGNDAILDPSIGMTMFCENYDEQLPIRPIDLYLCDDDSEVTPSPTIDDDDDEPLCCDKEEYERMVTAAGTNMDEGGYACCPDGTIGYGNDAIDPSTNIMTMYCGNKEYTLRPISDNFCEDTPSPTKDEDDVFVSSGNIFKFMIAIAFTLGLFGWM